MVIDALGLAVEQGLAHTKTPVQRDAALDEVELSGWITNHGWSTPEYLVDVTWCMS